MGKPRTSALESGVGERRAQLVEHRFVAVDHHVRDALGADVGVVMHLLGHALDPRRELPRQVDVHRGPDDTAGDVARELRDDGVQRVVAGVHVRREEGCDAARHVAEDPTVVRPAADHDDRVGVVRVLGLATELDALAESEAGDRLGTAGLVHDAGEDQAGGFAAVGALKCRGAALGASAGARVAIAPPEESLQRAPDAARLPVVAPICHRRHLLPLARHHRPPGFLRPRWRGSCSGPRDEAWRSVAAVVSKSVRNVKGRPARSGPDCRDRTGR